MQREHKLERLVRGCKKAINEGNTDPETYGNLSSALMDLGRFNESEEWCRSGLEIYPTSWVLHSNMGVNRRRIGKPADAIPYYDEAMRFYKRDHGGRSSSFIINNKAVAFAELEKYEDALKLLDVAIKEDPYDKDAYYNKIFILHGLSRNNEIMAFLNELERSGHDMDEIIKGCKEQIRKWEDLNRVSKGAR